MSNPFANPFGNQQNTQSVFGGTSSQQSAFGAGPVFGQQSLFGQPAAPSFPSQSVVSTPASLFGQSQTQSATGTRASIFSDQSTKSSAFGQTSVFGQSSGQVASSGFSKPSSAGSSLSSSSGTTLSGSLGQPETFQNTSGFTPIFSQTTTQSGLFTSSTNPSLFSGIGNVKTESEGATKSFFGSSGHFKSEPTPLPGITSAAGLFGKQSSTSESHSASASLFGKPSDSKNSGLVTTALFGKSATTAGSAQSSESSVIVKTEEVYDIKPQLFGAGNQASSAGIQATQPVGFFGKVKDENLAESKEPKTDPSTLFSSNKTNQKNESGGSAGSDGLQGAGLFGKGKLLSQTLFGKPVKKVDYKKGFEAENQENEDENPLREKEDGVSSTSAAEGLFGKHGRKEESSRTELLGEQEVPRQTASFSQEEREESRSSFRRQLSEEISNKVAIVCRNVPHKYNTAMHLRTHFKRFGEVTKVFPNQAKMQAIVHFKTHEAAADAKRRGRLLARGVLPMTVFWSSYGGSSTPKSNKVATDVEVKSSKSLKRMSDTDLMPKSKKPSWRESDTLEEELNTMSGTEDMKGRLNKLKRSPEKRARSVSPTPSTSVVDIKPEKIVISLFEGCVARTTSERVHLLQLRDKYIRQNRLKPKKDLVKAFIGTCPDMCPEKERYDREDKRQLSYYEIVPGTENIPGKNPQIDHRRAVKEYLRSSPDQDEPLPHELRPMPVLQMTMKYLLREVADKGEDGHWGDWFDFLWNRTRGIRKDIIQQQLNDRDAVALIEKCARFHIFSSERLCEEDMHSFDSKINNENLTKCLQTLKEFYADLEKKHRLFCDNEAEFRAYTVLMNLNEGDTLREVQQLHPDIRTSSAMKFALQAYFALNGNNYIRFFKLVKQASFTNACIMHRYFTQVRNRALTLMMRGYSMGNRSAQVPLSEIVRLLGFEDENEASDFCQHYGFNVTDGEVILDRAEYIEPDTAWPSRRSETLIESKFMVSVGELINGGPFTSTDYLSPVSSFDEDNRFHSKVALPKKGQEVGSGNLASSSAQSTSGVLQAEVRVKQEPVSVKKEPDRDHPPVPDKPSLKKVPVEFIKDSAKVLFWEVIDEVCKGIGEEVKSEVDARLLYSEDYLQSLLDTTLEREIKSLCENAFEEAQAIKRKASQLEWELRCDRVAELLTGDLVDEIADQESVNLAEMEMRVVKSQLRKECIERVTVDINSELVEEVMNEMVADVSEDVFETDVRQRLKQLDKFEKLVKLSRAGRFLHKWKKEYKAVTKLKRAMEEFPCAPSMQSKKDQLKVLLNVDDERIRDKKFFVNERAKLTIETPLEIEKHRKETETCALVHSLYRNLLHQIAWAPLDVGQAVGKHLKRKLRVGQHQDTLKKATLFWKLLLCLPDVDENSMDTSDVATKNLCKWLKVKFSKGSTKESECDVKGKVLSLYKCHLSDGLATKPLSVGICVRAVEGQLDVDDIAAIEEERLYLGTSALLFVLPAGAPFCKTNSVTYDHYWNAQYSRLKSVLDVRPRYQGFPLVVVVPVQDNQSVSSIEIVKCLHLEEMFDQELLSDMELLTYELNEKRPDGIDLVDPKVSQELCGSVQWLAGKTKPAPCLNVQYFKDLVDITLQKHYYTQVHLNNKKRKELQRLNKDPNSLLGLYNTVITHVSEVLTSDRLYRVSWPVSEFICTYSQEMPPSHWNKGDHLEYLFSIVDSLRLPEFVLEYPDSEDWFDVKRDLWKFVTSFAGNDCSGARIKLISRLKSLIHRLEVDFEEACYFQTGVSDCQPTFFNVPWSTVVSLCIDYKLDCVDLCDPDSRNPQETREELMVAYVKDEMDSFIPPESWKYTGDSTILESPSLEETINRVVHKVQEERSKNITKTEISIAEEPSNVTVITRDTKKTSSTLIKSLKSERRQSDHFQKYLEDALKGSDLEPDTTLSANALFSEFESEHQMFAAANFSSNANERRFSYDPMSYQRSLTFDATTYFNQSQNNISAIFDNQVEGRSFLPQRRRSDIGLQELSLLPEKKRRERLSEIYDNDKVMIYLKEPTVKEDLDNFKENLKASRRESDLFEKKLKHMLEGHLDAP